MSDQETKETKMAEETNATSAQNNDRNNDWECDTHLTADILRIVIHMNAALFLCGNQFDGCRLNDRNQSHVRIGRHRNRPNVV